MTKVSRVKKQKRLAAYRKTDAFAKTVAICRNCGEKGPHFVPPGLGMPGFFSCLKPGQTQDEKDEEVREIYMDYNLGREPFLPAMLSNDLIHPKSPLKGLSITYAVVDETHNFGRKRDDG